jgi:Tol biopolymer transport system component/DNA-binding winged helix-turn-helix (wHTH) protein
VEAASPNRVRLGAFEFDLQAGELLAEDRKVRLQEQPFQILLMLVNCSGGLVTVQAIRRQLWPNNTVVEFDHSIHTAIKKLRHAFGDSAEDPKYIETVARRGYRLMVPVEPLNGSIAPLQAGSSPSTPAVPPADYEAQPSGSNTSTFSALNATRALLYLFTLIILALAAFWTWREMRRPAANRTLTQRQLTHNTPENRNLGSAISPDGTRLLYADTKGLHLSLIDTGEIHDIPLPENIQAKLWDVAWFPDGQKVLLTAQTDGLTIWLTSIFGDTPRPLRTHAKSANVSPQGTSIAFVGGDGHEIWVMDADGNNQRKIFSNAPGRCVAPVWSPTGQRIAFITPKSESSQLGGAIKTIALDGAAPRVLLSDAGLVTSGSISNRLLWLRDGRLIFAKSEHFRLADENLWQVMADPHTGETSGHPTKITNWFSTLPILLSASNDATRLVLTQAHVRDDLYIGELEHNGTVLQSPKRLTVNDSENYADSWSRDAKALLFESDRMGRVQIFRQQIQQDSPESFILGPDDERAATLSPDGSWILYWNTLSEVGSPPALTRLSRLSTSGGTPQEVLELPTESTPNFDCSGRAGAACVLSRLEQGHLIFYALDPLQGIGKEFARTDDAATEIPWSLSPDGTRVAITTVNHDALHIVDLPNRTQQTVKVPGVFIWSLCWAADGTALFATISRSTEYLIVRIELDGTTHDLLNRGRTQWLAFPRPSPDGRYLAFSQQTFETKVWLLENF